MGHRIGHSLRQPTAPEAETGSQAERRTSVDKDRYYWHLLVPSNPPSSVVNVMHRRFGLRAAEGVSLVTCAWFESVQDDNTGELRSFTLDVLVPETQTY